MSKKKPKTIKIWWIRDGDNKGGYWTDTLEPIPYEFLYMEGDEKFTISTQELTIREYNKLVKTSHEFEGW